MMLLAVPMPLSSHSASAAGAVVGAGARVGGRRALSWAHRDGASARDGAVWIGASAGVWKRAAPARVRLAFGGGALPGVPLRRAPGGGELCGFGELCGWGGGGGVWSDGGCKAPPERPWRVAEATRGGGWRGRGHGRCARQGRRGGVGRWRGGGGMRRAVLGGWRRAVLGGRRRGGGDGGGGGGASKGAPTENGGGGGGGGGGGRASPCKRWHRRGTRSEIAHARVRAPCAAVGRRCGGGR